jgi:hypothetical protein
MLDLSEKVRDGTYVSAQTRGFHEPIIGRTIEGTPFAMNAEHFFSRAYLFQGRAGTRNRVLSLRTHGAINIPLHQRKARKK